MVKKFGNRYYRELGRAEHQRAVKMAQFIRSKGLNARVVRSKYGSKVFTAPALRTFNRMSNSWKLTKDQYLNKMLTGVIDSSAYKSQESQIDFLVGDPDPLTTLPDDLVKITDRGKKAYIPENQMSARPYGGQWFTNWEDAENYALRYANSQRNEYSSQKLPGRGSYPRLLSKRGGIEYRQSGRKLSYVAKDNDNVIKRNANGDAVMMSDPEIKSASLPLYSRTIVAFDGDTPVGYVSDEWGVPGVWVIKAYQGQNIGLNILDAYAEQGENIGFEYSLSSKGSLGQATQAGRRLAGKYHKLLVERALASGKDVPSNVLKDYPDLR